MTAHAAARPIPADPAPPVREAMRLSTLLAAAAERHPERLALLDQPGREDWSGRPRIAWTASTADEIRRRLTAFFAGLGLAPGAVVGLCLPGGSEACLTLLAVEEAGLTPCLLAVAWDEPRLADAIEAAGVQVVVTQGVVGELRPAEAFCRLAARYFGLRFVAAYGPLVPDGVIDLDRVILSQEGAEPGPGASPDTAEGGIVTFSRRPGGGALYRPVRSVVAAAMSVLDAAPVEAGERILTLLAPDDHRGLTLGLTLGLLAGAALEHHGLFDGRGLAESLAQALPIHLVAPGWLEPQLAKGGLPPSVRSVVLVHDAPVRFKARTSLARRVVDVLALDEIALVARARRGDRFALTLAEPGGSAPFLRVRTGEDGLIEVAGAACDVRDFARGQAGPAPASEWRSTGFRAETFSGIVIGVA